MGKRSAIDGLLEGFRSAVVLLPPIARIAIAAKLEAMATDIRGEARAEQRGEGKDRQDEDDKGIIHLWLGR